MKKIIVLLIVTLRMFLVFPINVSNTTSIDEETGETIITGIYENEEDGLVKKIMWMKGVPVLKYMEDFSVVRYMEEYYGEGNSDGFTISKTYNYNLNTKSYDRMETYYREDSNRIVCCTIPELVNGKVRYVATIEYKPMNTENIDKEVCVLSEDRKPISKTVYYNENSILRSLYVEYMEDDKCPIYVKHEFRKDSRHKKTVESYYSYPDYKHSDENPYYQVVLYEDHPQGLKKRTLSHNDDGTYFVDFIVNPQLNNDYKTREVTKHRKDKTEIYSEEYYEDKLYCGKVYKTLILWVRKGVAGRVIYYDKEGNEIPESEIKFSEIQ